MIELAIVIGILLTLAGLMDFYNKSVPSVFLTSIGLIVLLMNTKSIIFGLIALVFALLLWEFGEIEGIADVKIISIIGMMIMTMPYFLLSLGLIVIFGFFYKATFKYFLKYKEGEQIPYALSLVAVYWALFFLGGLI